jgi:2-keto-3-deoxy-6-phosphogluconate aldolase
MPWAINANACVLAQSGHAAAEDAGTVLHPASAKTATKAGSNRAIKPPCAENVCAP